MTSITEVGWRVPENMASPEASFRVWAARHHGVDRKRVRPINVRKQGIITSWLSFEAFDWERSLGRTVRVQYTVADATDKPETDRQLDGGAWLNYGGHGGAR